MIDQLTQFKAFHRAVCGLFNYPHDEQFWWRDQVSLIEHIVALQQAPQVAQHPKDV